MNDPHFVTRTAAGLSHGNTLALWKLWTVIIYIDAPDEQANERDIGDRYQLVSDDGLYDRTLDRSAAVLEDDDRLALRFTEVVPEGTYSLYHQLLCGIEFPVFMEVPFTVLEDHGEETPQLANETWEAPAFQPEPELVSGDPLLLYDPIDLWLPDPDAEPDDSPEDQNSSDEDASDGQEDQNPQDGSPSSPDDGPSSSDDNPSDPPQSGESSA